MDKDNLTNYIKTKVIINKDILETLLDYEKTIVYIDKYKNGKFLFAILGLSIVDNGILRLAILDKQELKETIYKIEELFNKHSIPFLYIINQLAHFNIDGGMYFFDLKEGNLEKNIYIDGNFIFIKNKIKEEILSYYEQNSYCFYVNRDLFNGLYFKDLKITEDEDAFYNKAYFSDVYKFFKKNIFLKNFLNRIIIFFENIDIIKTIKK